MKNVNNPEFKNLQNRLNELEKTFFILKNNKHFKHIQREMKYQYVRTHTNIDYEVIINNLSDKIKQFYI